jgi:chromatin remodeling complex protein RSC6
MLTWTVC